MHRESVVPQILRTEPVASGRFENGFHEPAVKQTALPRRIGPLAATGNLERCLIDLASPDF
jgi:hypothetical protein